MTPNTLTTLKQLPPGAVFQLENKEGKLIKTTGEPLRKNKEVFDCWAKPYPHGVIPTAYKGKTPVIYLHLSKRIVI